MSTSEGPAVPSGGLLGRLSRPAKVIIVTSVMFTFISYWRTAAVVLCDLASTAYYIGGIVEQAIGPAAPWFILAVMLFSYAVRWVYIESCTLFVRGGVYRVVKTALGGTMAKLAVSALIFDYLLTGPISSVSAGQYIVGLGLDTLALIDPGLRVEDAASRDAIRQWGAVLVAVFIILYFFRQNLLGIHESSGKALKIMIATTVMVVIILAWCGLTLLVHGPRNKVPAAPDLSPKVEYEVVKAPDRVWGEEKEVEMWKRDESGRFVPRLDEQGNPVQKLNEVTHDQEDPLGFLSLFPSLAEPLRRPAGWLTLAGVVGLCIAFGHSILAMSGEETLAQVYREVASPKLQNFKKAAFIVFVFSLLMTATFSFLAVLIIPDEVRLKEYKDNLISGLAMYVLGPAPVRLLLSAFVVVIGAFILSGAVNTAIIGSNGVLNRVAEDGVLHNWFLKPHRKYGTTYRILYLIVGLQLIIILVSRGHTLLLGEAYAFGVVWSFVFQALSMIVLRFKGPRPRDYKVPFNLRLGRWEVPLGLGVILLVLLTAALLNFLTKEVATVSGLAFTLGFFTLFWLSERYHEKQRRGGPHEHLEQFNRETAPEVTADSLGLTKQYRKLVAIRSPHNLFMLEKALAETDPETTGVVVMTAKVMPTGEAQPDELEIDPYDQQLMTAVVQRAERAGKLVRPMIVPTNNPMHAVMKTASDLQAHEVIMGASNKYTADEQLDQIAFYWINIHGGQPAPLTVRVLSRDRDMALDLGGGNRIPKISERRARTVAELRAAGVGVDRLLMIHEGTPLSSDLFQAVLTMLDPEVVLDLVPLLPPGDEGVNGYSTLMQDEERARQLGREMKTHEVTGDVAAAVVRLAREGGYDLIVLPLPAELSADPDQPLDERARAIMRHAHCPVFLAAPPVIPHEVVDTTPSAR
jgi:amino acid transporter/nucleotide-binding universal stress UspA family protein